MHSQDSSSNTAGPLSQLERIHGVCLEFETAWRSGERPSIEERLAIVADSDRVLLLRELLRLEFDYRARSGLGIDVPDYLKRFPAESTLIRSVAAEVATNSYNPIPADLQPGQLFGSGDQYEIVALVGSGGMGHVYQARHRALDATVAIKVLSAAIASKRQAAERFQREMKAMGRLSELHVVKASDAGQSGDRLFLAMEFVDGIDLGQLSRRMGPMAVPDACELIRQAALGLQHVHANALVHRDIKPSNLMLTSTANPSSPDGQKEPLVKILDLGLARLQEESGHDITSTNQIMGTIDYISPEQSDNTHTVDIRADIYSLGATFYRLLTGVSPLSTHETPVQKMRALIREAIPPVTDRRRDLPAELVPVLERMLARDPADRYQTPREAAAALAAFTSGQQLVDLLAIARSAVSSPETMTDVGDGTATSTRQDLPASTTTITHEQPSSRAWTRRAIAGALIVAAAGLAYAILGPEDGPRPTVGVPVFSSGTSAPLSRVALVPRPATMTDVESWTVETIGHRAAVLSVAISHDGNRMATACVDGSIRVWNYVTGDLQRILIGHDHSVHDVEWSPQGLLYSCSRDGTIREWDADSGRQLHVERRFAANAMDLAVSHDGRRLAVISRDRVAVVWQLDGWKELFATDPVDRDEWPCVGWSANDRYLAVSGNYSSIRILEADDPSSVKLVHADMNRFIPAFAWSPGDPNVLAWMADRLHAEICRIGSEDPTRKIDFNESFYDLTFSPDGNHLALTGNNGLVELWSTAEGDLVSRISARDVLLYEYAKCVAFAPDGQSLVSVGDRGVARKYRVNSTLEAERDFGAPLNSSAVDATWSPDSKYVATMHGGQRIHVWATADGTLSSAFNSGPYSTGESLAWSEDGEVLAIGHHGRQGQTVRLVPITADGIPRDQAGHFVSTLLPYDWLSWSPGHRLLAAANSDDPPRVVLFDAHRRDVVQSWHLPTRAKAPVWEPSGEHLAVPIGDAVNVYRFNRVEPVCRVSGHKTIVTAVTWSPDGSRLASINRHGDVIISGFPDGKMAGFLKCNTVEAVTSLVWLGENTIVGASLDGMLVALDVKSGKQERHVTGASSGVFSPSNRRLVSVSRQSVLDDRGAFSTFVRTWDVMTGEPGPTSVALPDHAWFAVTPSGDVQGSDGFESKIVYVVSTSDGQETLTVSEFRDRYSQNESTGSVIALPESVE